MSAFEELMFEAEFDRITETLTANHAHTGEGCVFCANAAGVEAKDAGTAAVTRDPVWWQEANNWLNCREYGHRFTADDLVAAIGKPTGSTNQIGARLRSWAMAEVIDPVGFTEAERPESHGRVLRVWEVKI